MSDVRKHRAFICFVAAFVLLSFFFAVPTFGGEVQSGKRTDIAAAGSGIRTDREFAESRIRTDREFAGSRIRTDKTPAESEARLAAVGTECTGSARSSELCATEPVGEREQGLPSGNASVSLARILLNEIAARGQQATRTFLVRFFAVLTVIILCISSACRIAMRRFSVRMIPVWENIYYIHQMDGEKGNAILYT